MFTLMTFRNTTFLIINSKDDFEIELIFREQSSGSQLIREAESLEGQLTAKPASSVLSEGGNETGLASMTVAVRDMLGMVLIL